jgi:tetraacyldisaccharide 4'-kinase
MMLEKIFLDEKRKNTFSFFLYPLSKIYKKCIDFRHFLYRNKVLKEYPSPIFTVCVGSIFIGGSGKTPFVRLLLEHLGEDVFVLSRGYKNLDEPLFYRNCVIQKDRVQGAKDCLEKGAKAIIMDDGLQHLRLKKDVKIAVLTKEQLNKGWDFIPLGSLRDTPSILKNIDVVVLHEMETAEDYLKAQKFLKSFNIPRFIGTQTEFSGFFTLDQVPVSQVKKALLFSGIARPHRFRKMCESLGVEVIDHEIVSDHDRIDLERLNRLIHRAQSEEAYLIMTEKDAVKYPKIEGVLHAKIRTKVTFDQQNFDYLIGKFHETMD